MMIVNDKMKAIITVGISGSGKTTWAENYRFCIHSDTDKVVINRDETRWKLSGKLGWNGPNAYRFHSDMETAVTHHNAHLIEMCSIEGKDIIIADTNLNPKTRNKLIKQCTDLGYEVDIKEFPISFQEACKRDIQRGIFAVGETVLMKQWEQWCKYFADREESNA